MYVQFFVNLSGFTGDEIKLMKHSGSVASNVLCILLFREWSYTSSYGYRVVSFRSVVF